MFCPHRGSKLNDDSNLCGSCGKSIDKNTTGVSLTSNGSAQPHTSQKDAPKKKLSATAIIGIFIAFCFTVGLTICLTVVFMGLTAEDNLAESETTFDEASENTNNPDIPLSENSLYDPRIDPALSALGQKWSELYDETDNTDGYLEVKSVRIIDIKPNENELFGDIEYIVEFTLLSDYYGSYPYYQNIGNYDTVVFYKDGSIDIPTNNLFRIYSSRTYSYDYSDFIADIMDCGASYNGVLSLKSGAIESTSAMYVPGTYTGYGKGFNVDEDIVVSVTVDQNNILSITVEDHYETVGTGTKAFSILPDLIIKANSTNVDAVTGATITSKGFLEAVEDALQQAKAS